MGEQSLNSASERELFFNRVLKEGEKFVVKRYEVELQWEGEGEKGM